MTIAQLQNRQAFVANHSVTSSTGETIRKTTGDQAYIVISTDHNGVPHVGDEAPISIPHAGTPNACKSLQTVTFTDMAGDKHIVGWKGGPDVPGGGQAAA
jgi:hypothetical protein